jgi:hypothetical protein
MNQSYLALLIIILPGFPNISTLAYGSYLICTYVDLFAWLIINLRKIMKNHLLMFYRWNQFAEIYEMQKWLLSQSWTWPTCWSCRWSSKKFGTTSTYLCYLTTWTLLRGSSEKKKFHYSVFMQIQYFLCIVLAISRLESVRSCSNHSLK